MGLLNVLVLGVAAFGLSILQDVNASCRIIFEPPEPQVVTHFGSKHLVAEPTSSVIRENHETLDLYCVNGFRLFRHNYSPLEVSNPHIKLKCSSNQVFVFDESSSQDFETPYEVSCLGNQVTTMYESRKPMAGCDGYMSLVVGQNFGKWGSRKSVAICYDILKQQLKHVSYTAYPTKTKVLEQTQVGQLNDLGMDISVAYTRSLFKTVSATAISEAFEKDKQLKAVFTDQTFEYTSLIQDKAFESDLLGFNEMLSIVWLRALRNGNWRHLLNALEIASLNAKFDVRVGYSGIISLPQLHSCNETSTLTIELDSGDILSVPSHIWAHVRALEPTSSATDEFVVVAHNSPFLTSNGRDGLCKSMCDEVSWLRNSLFGKLQHYPIYGSVQCCRVADVQNKLDNFVQIVKPTPSPVIVETEGSLQNIN